MRHHICPPPTSSHNCVCVRVCLSVTYGSHMEASGRRTLLPRTLLHLVCFTVGPRASDISSAGPHYLQVHSTLLSLCQSANPVSYHLNRTLPACAKEGRNEEERAAWRWHVEGTRWMAYLGQKNSSKAVVFWAGEQLEFHFQNTGLGGEAWEG